MQPGYTSTCAVNWISSWNVWKGTQPIVCRCRHANQSGGSMLSIFQQLWWIYAYYCILIYQYMLTTEQLLQTYAYYYTGYAFYCTFPELLPIYATYSTLCVLLPILSFTLQYRRIAIPRSIGAVRPLSRTIVDYVSASLFPRASTPFAFF